MLRRRKECARGGAQGVVAAGKNLLNIYYYLFYFIFVLFRFFVAIFSVLCRRYSGGDHRLPGRRAHNREDESSDGRQHRQGSVRNHKLFQIFRFVLLIYCCLSISFFYFIYFYLLIWPFLSCSRSAGRGERVAVAEAMGRRTAVHTPETGVLSIGIKETTKTCILIPPYGAVLAPCSRNTTCFLNEQNVRG